MTLKNNNDAEVNRIHLPTIIGKSYREFWLYKGRYRVVKGSRASKKSKTTALWFIVNLIKYPEANILVVRKTYNSLRESCFTELKWAINHLGLSAHFKIVSSPLRIEYIPTGQKIYFRGLDNPYKITSITVDNGYLCWLWIEEAYEILDEDHFNILDESIRGKMADNLFKQATITFNPWNEHHWLKKRFFDSKRDSVLALTTNYLCNEWLDEADKKLFEDMKENNPRRYWVAGLGNWGVVDGLVYENFEELDFDIDEVRKRPTIKSVFGLDFGYTNDPSALFCGFVDINNRLLYVFDEIYKKGLTNPELFKQIENEGYKKEKIIADSAEPKSIAELRQLGLRHIQKSRKGKDSVINGITNIQSFKIFIHPRCTNFMSEISMYTWMKNKEGKSINEPIGDNNHLMDAMRYALEFNKREKFSYE